MRNLVMFLFLLLTSLSFSQETGTVRGAVLDGSMGGEPLIFAHVSMKNMEVAVETNLHGNFEMPSITPGSYVLVVSYPGYQQLEIPVEVERNGTAVVNGTMQVNEISVKGPVLLDHTVSGLHTGAADASEAVFQ